MLTELSNNFNLGKITFLKNFLAYKAYLLMELYNKPPKGSTGFLQRLHF
jgi:hypothetical protein